MKKKVLIVDDSEENQYLLRMLLEADGCQVDCESNGEDALSFLSTCLVKPDLILLDLHMPVMGGVDFLNSRNLVPSLKSIPVVLMSGDEDIRATGAINGIANVLEKPLNVSSVVQAVKHFRSSVNQLGEQVARD